MPRLLGFSVGFWACVLTAVLMSLPLLLEPSFSRNEKARFVTTLAIGLGILGTYDIYRLKKQDEDPPEDDGTDGDDGPLTPRHP